MMPGGLQEPAIDTNDALKIWLNAPLRCSVVQEIMMPLNGAKSSSAARQPRASVTFPPELYQTLEDLAKRKKVSLAWVVREAAEKYVADQWPLFSKTQQENHGR